MSFFHERDKIFKIRDDSRKYFNEFPLNNYYFKIIDIKIFQKHLNIFEIRQFLSTFYLSLFSNNVIIDRYVQKHENKKKFFCLNN